MKTSSLTILFMLVCGCQQSPKQGVDFSNQIEETRRVNYILGRSAGVNAMYRLRLRELETGQTYTPQEAYDLADSVAKYFPGE
jgi:hypothetical protein